MPAAGREQQVAGFPANVPPARGKRPPTHPRAVWRAVAHDFTTEERRRGAQRTNEIKRKRAARRIAAADEPLDLAEKLYLLQADKHLLIQALNRLSQELCCSDCRRALAAIELVLKYLVKPGMQKEPGFAVAASTITQQVRELGFNAEVEKVATDGLRGNA
jgi:hypothetical protein